jgi:hypothetical protein
MHKGLEIVVGQAGISPIQNQKTDIAFLVCHIFFSTVDILYK